MSEVQISNRSNQKQYCQRLTTTATFSLEGAVMPGCSDEEMGPANSLDALTYNSEHNKRFDFESRSGADFKLFSAS